MIRRTVVELISEYGYADGSFFQRVARKIERAQENSTSRGGRQLGTESHVQAGTFALAALQLPLSAI